MGLARIHQHLACLLEAKQRLITTPPIQRGPSSASPGSQPRDCSSHNRRVSRRNAIAAIPGGRAPVLLVNQGLRQACDEQIDHAVHVIPGIHFDADTQVANAVQEV